MLTNKFLDDLSEQVYMEPLTAKDLTFILSSLFPSLHTSLVEGMVRFSQRLAVECGHEWATRGAPWEMNLRDLTRWAEAITIPSDRAHPERYVGVIYADRMRTAADKQKVCDFHE